jgi:hypothetical protein
MPELGTRLPNPLNSLTIGAIFFSKIIYNFITSFTYGYKKGETTNFFFTLLFLLLDPGSEIRDLKKIRIQDPGLTSWIRNTVYKYRYTYTS